MHVQVPSIILASVDGAFNAVLVEGEAAGRLMFYGQGVAAPHGLGGPVGSRRRGASPRLWWLMRPA